MRSALMALAALLVLGAALPAAGEQPRLRRWQVGLQAVTTERDQFDVFAVPDIPAAAVESRGEGAGLQIGRRMGDRFVLGLQLVVAGHRMAGTDRDLDPLAVEVLVTGTVLFRERATLQPFLRGAVGAGGILAELGDDRGHLFSFGTATVAGGGCLVRLGDRVSLELEAVATFTNFIEVQNESTDPRWEAESWQVRGSDQGWRVGAGLQFWF